MPTHSLSEALHRLTHAYKRQLRAAIREQQIQLPVTHIRALKGVCRNPECTAQSIATRMQRDKAQITRVLNELLQAGLIEKIDNPNDRRSQLLRPTREGEKTMDQIKLAEQQTADRLTRQLGPDDLESFIRIANTMSDSVDEELLPQADTLSQTGE